MSRQINVGVVGCGYWGPNLIRNYASLLDCRMKVMCDLSEKRLNELKGRFPGVQQTMDYSDLLQDGQLDAVVIATSVGQHYKMAKASLEAGKHTFIEKPMASSSAQCEELIDIAERKGLVLMVGHTFLYSAPVAKIKELISNQENFGQLQYISSRRLNLGLFQKDINVTWDLAPHDISIILHIMEDFPVSLNCQGNAHVMPGIEDVTNMSMFFTNGRFATVQNSWLDPKKVREMTLVGSKQMIVYDDVEPLEKVKIYNTRVEKPPHYNTFDEWQYAYFYGDRHVPHIKLEEPLKVECQHFLSCIKEGGKPLSCGDQGLQLVKILEASSASLKQNGARVHLGGSARPRPAHQPKSEPALTK